MKGCIHAGLVTFGLGCNDSGRDLRNPRHLRKERLSGALFCQPVKLFGGQRDHRKSPLPHQG